MTAASVRCQTFSIQRIEHILTCIVLALSLVCPALAAPITYTGFTITNGKIGTHVFHNARVILTFVSDTKNVQLTTLLGTNVAYNPTGTASITIVGDKLSIQAAFAANQIFVSVDRTNGGVGFGSFAADGSLQPVYPLGIGKWMVLGALPGGTFLLASPEERSLSTDLRHNTSFAGVAWSCTAFPLQYGLTCPLPTAPLKTNKGDLYLYEPYQYPGSARSINTGFFFADLGTFQHTLPPNIYRPSSLASSGPMTYHAFLFGDVTLGKQVFKRAKVLFTLVSNSGWVQPLSGSDPNAYINGKGTAQVTVMTGSTVVTATFSPNQIYVYFTPGMVSMGFGSTAGGRNYPLAISNDSCLCFQELFTITAVSDIVSTPGDASQYTPEVASLVTDLRNETMLGGAAFSCPTSDPLQTGCSSLTSPPKLATNNGAFSIYEPYTESFFWSPPYPVSLNGALFWSNFN
jgi:hypothetical protein